MKETTLQVVDVPDRGRLLLCSLISSLTNCMTFWLTVANFVHHFAIENV